MGFGTWNLREVAPRRVKSIRGGDQITIPARKRVGFSVGAVLSQAAQENGSARITGTRGRQKAASAASNGQAE
jgi:DNA-binding protein HU-beta